MKLLLSTSMLEIFTMNILIIFVIRGKKKKQEEPMLPDLLKKQKQKTLHWFRNHKRLLTFVVSAERLLPIR